MDAEVVRRENNRWTFAGEKLHESPRLAQSYLSALGRRIEQFTFIDDTGFRRYVDAYRRKTLDLKPDRMEVLKRARKLWVRNGDDIPALLHLVNKHQFVGKILVPNEEISTFLKIRFNQRPRGLSFTTYDVDYNSEDEEIRARDRNNMSDRSSDGDDNSPPEKRRRRPAKAAAADDESDGEVDYASSDSDSGGDEDGVEGGEIPGSTGYYFNYDVVV